MSNVSLFQGNPGVQGMPLTDDMAEELPWQTAMHLLSCGLHAGESAPV